MVLGWLTKKYFESTMKLELWERKVKDGNLSMFENLDEALDKNKNTGNVDVVQLVQAHLASLRIELQSYFTELSELESKLIRNPFIVNVHLLPDNMQEEFLELVNDSVAKDAFETLTLTKFWSKISETYPVLSDVVMNSLLMFPSIYLCEQGFSTLLNMKTKYRSRLNVEHDLRVCLSNTAPRIEKLVYKKTGTAFTLKFSNMLLGNEVNTVCFTSVCVVSLKSACNINASA